MRLGFSLVAALLCWAGLGAVASAQQPLDVTFSTPTLSGGYEPSHVLAVWVDAADGSFQRTLFVWGSRRRSHLTQWGSARNASDALDGITSATLRGPSTQTVHWNMADYTGATVPDGDYIVHFELADTNSSSQNRRASFTFTKTTDSSSTGPADDPTSTYRQVTIVYTAGDVVVVEPDAGTTEPPDAGHVVVPPGDDAGFTDPGGGDLDGGLQRFVPIGRSIGSAHCAVAAPGARAGASGAALAFVGLFGLAALWARRRRVAARRAR